MKGVTHGSAAVDRLVVMPSHDAVPQNHQAVEKFGPTL